MADETKVLYQARATAVGGREGKVASDDENLSVELSIPKALGGPGKPGTTNPEQLFTAGYAACFESAIRHVARLRKTQVGDLRVESQVSLLPAGEGFKLAVALKPVFSGLDADAAKALVEAADRVCPYSNALRNNVVVTIDVVS